MYGSEKVNAPNKAQMVVITKKWNFNFKIKQKQIGRI